MPPNSNLFEENVEFNCFKCKRNRTEGYKLNCGHKFCMKCFQQLLFNKCINKIKDLNIFNIECSCNDTSSSMSIEELYNFLLKNLQNDVLPLENEKCPIHAAQPSSLFCKTCDTDICNECAISDHESHNYSSKQVFSEQFHSYLKQIPLIYRNINAFTNHYNEITNNFQNKVKKIYKETVDCIDSLISSLNEIKLNFSKLIKERLSKGVLLMKIIKMFYAHYYLNYENQEKIEDIYTLRYLRDISYELSDFSFEMDTYIVDDINKIKVYVDKIKTKKYDYFKINVENKETSKVFSQEKKIKCHTKEITAIIRLDDGRLVTGGGDYSIRFWELKGDTFENTISIEEFTGFVMALYQLNDKRIISSSKDKNDTRIWDNPSGKYKCEITLSEHTKYVTCFIQLADNRLVTGSKDSHICIWAPSKKLFICQNHLKEHQEGVYSLLELSGNKIASGSEDKTIRIWEGKDNGFSCVQILEGHTKRVKALAKLSGERERFISGGDDCSIKVWELDQQGSYKNTSSFEAHDKGILFLSVLKDSKILSTSKDKSIKIWQIFGNDLSIKEELKGHERDVFGAVELEDGRIASCGRDNMVILWKSGTMHEE